MNTRTKKVLLYEIFFVKINNYVCILKYSHFLCKLYNVLFHIQNTLIFVEFKKTY